MKAEKGDFKMTMAIKYKAEIESILNCNRELISTFYARLVLGYEGKKESRLYIDLNSLDVFFVTSSFSSKNSNSANSPSWYQLDYNNGQGIGLSKQDEKVFLNTPDALLSGLHNYLKSYLIPRLVEALEQRTKRIK